MNHARQFPPQPYTHSARGRWRRLAAVPLLILAACSGSDGPTDPGDARKPASIVAHAGAVQSAPAGREVAVPPAVLVKNASGAPLSGITVEFTVAAGGGQVTGGTPLTDASGVARVGSWVLGTSGQQRLTARVGTLSVVTFEAEITPEAAETFTAGGGTLTIDELGHPYDGLSLTVPAGAFPEGSDWSIRVDETAPPVSLPAGFTVAGPTLEIRTSAARAASLLTLDIPVPDPAGRAIVVALRDPVRGVMEVLPTVGRSSGSIRVMTGHLRGDLLLGPSGGSSDVVRDPGGVTPARSPGAELQNPWPGSPAVASYSADTGPSGIAHLIPIEMLIPTVPASVEINRWPILDHGSTAFPEGFGPAISALEVAGSTQRGGLYSAAVRSLATAGFYAEPGPLAAIHQVNRTLAQGIQSVARELTAALSTLPKAEQDELVHRNVLANLHLSGIPPMVAAVTAGGEVGTIVGAAVEGSESELILAVPTSQQTVTLPRTGAGFMSIPLPTIVGGVPIQVRSIVPLTSLTAPFERIRTIAERISRLAELEIGSDARHQLNQELANEAGLEQPVVEFRADDEAEWQPVTGGSLIARAREVLVRVAGSAATYHGSSGEQIGQSVGGEIALAQDEGLFAASASTSVARTLSIAATSLGGVIRQVAPVTLRIANALFQLDPLELTLEDGGRRVEFSASVPHPPEGGFRIEWDWGDGTTTETVNTADATYEYAVAGDYTVTATLFRTDGNRLARTTGQVRGGAVPAWRITSFVDQDELFSDEDIEGSGPLADMLQRLLAAPASGLIAIESTGEGSSRLLLRARRSAVWTGAEEGPPPPPAALAEHLQPLGTDPPTQHQVGPFFAGWEADYWRQSTSDLTTGSMEARQALGHTTYQIEDAGTQRGPAGAMRFAAERDGSRMTGVVVAVIWWQDDDTGEVDGPGEEFRFPFQAVRWGADQP